MQNSSKSVGDDNALKRLSAMRNLLADPSKWTQAAFARASDGTVLLRGYDKRATCWCLIGASMHCASGGVFAGPTPRRALERAINERTGTLLSAEAFNDEPSTTHADVLAVIDRAIELAKEEAAND
jgi:hypothetical protein